MTERLRQWRCTLSIVFLGAVFSGCGGGGGGSTPPVEPPQPPAPITYSIQISTPPVSADVRVGQNAEATLEWRYTSSATNPSAISYTVTSSTEGLVISGGSGTSLPNTTISTELSFACTDIGTVAAELAIAVGTASADVAWSINCSGQRITIESIDASVASVGFDAVTEVAWRYETIGEAAAELAYAVSSSVEALLINPSEGTASPGVATGITLTYRCESAGTLEIPLTISVGTATQSATWQVACTTETIHIGTVLDPIEISVGEIGTTDIEWWFVSTGSAPRELSYLLQTSNERLSIENAEGVAESDATVRNQLSFECEVAGTHEIVFSISVGSGNQDVTWSITCTVEVIEIRSSSLLAAVSIGEPVESELVWRISTSGTDEDAEFEYLVDVEEPRIQVTGAAGVAKAGTDISARFSYQCLLPESKTFVITIHVGTSVATTAWMVDCSRETVEIAQPLTSASDSLGTTITRTLVWLVATTAKEPREFAYAIESSSDLLSIEPTEGKVLPGVGVATRVQLDCADTTRLNASVAIGVGSERETVVWTVECTEEEIVVEASPPAVSTSVGQTITAQLKWRFLTSAVQERQFSYAITTTSEQVDIDSAMAETDPGTLISTDLAFVCEDEGIVDIPLKVVVGSAMLEFNWSVECSVETIDILSSPSTVSISQGKTARGTFAWRIESTSERRESHAYQITSDLDGLQISPAAGTATAGQELVSTVVFDCAYPRSEPATFSIAVGSAVATVTWQMECTEESIVLTNDPLPESNAAIGETVRYTFRWTLSSTATVPRSFGYGVTASHANLGISNSAGNIEPGETVEHELSFSCSREQDVAISLLIKAGEVERETEWRVQCTRDTINFITRPMPQSIAVGESTTAALIWQFQSSLANRSASYLVSSSLRGVQIRNGAGSVRSGETVETTLRLACSSRRESNIELTITAGGATRTTTWRVACFGEDLTALSANFYQGPLIQRVDFEHNAGGWQHEVVSGLHAGGSEPLQLRTNRQIFIEIQMNHNAVVPLPLNLRLNINGGSSEAELVREVETEELSSGSEFSYRSRFLFDVKETAFTDLGNLQILIDPDSRYPESDESNNRIVYALDNQNTSSMPRLEIVYIPIRSREGVPNLRDLSYFTDPIYELLPVSQVTSVRGDELDLRSYSWNADNGRLFIDELYDFYLRNARRGEIYQGIAVPSEEDGATLCGIAYVGGSVSITSAQSGECAQYVSAHELGHNFNLNHAPACGAENENPDDDYPYLEGNIGSETGWLMKRQEFIDGSAPPEFVQLNYRYYDTMSYCPEVFTSQYSYGKSLANLRNRTNIVASRPIAAVFDPSEGKSIVIRGTRKGSNWNLESAKTVAREPLGFQAGYATHTIQLVDLVSGAVMYQEPILVQQIADIEAEEQIWGARVPHFDIDSLRFLIVDRLDDVVFEHVVDLNKIEQAD